MAQPLPSPSFPRGAVFYTNDQGEAGALDPASGGPPYQGTPVVGSWVQKTHPQRILWVADEEKQRASYVGTKRHLAQFLVPHRFEGKKGRAPLPRAALAYSVGLNSSYLQEIVGHIRVTPAHYSWGVLGSGKDDEDTVLGPKGGVAKDLWENATGDGKSWTEFFESTVLEWMLTSTGGFIVIDSNRPDNEVISRLDATKQGIRTTLKWVPNSAIEDFGRNAQGYWWVKLREVKDTRTPRMSDRDTGSTVYHVVYQLRGDGQTTIIRYDDKGLQVGPTYIQSLRTVEGVGVLPFVPVGYGEHPDFPFFGSGLLMGLDDIVIDLYNLLTEVREAYRGTVFTFLAYRGPDMEGVKQQLDDGGRLVHIGDDQWSSLDIKGGNSGEVDAGLRLIEMDLKNWAVSAKRRAWEASQMVSSTARTGVSLKAEFQLDLVPLMVAITEKLDEFENQTMFLVAQMEGYTPEEAASLSVARETAFQMEDEASRIARICDEFLQSIPGMPSSVLSRLIQRWAMSLGFLDPNEVVKTGDGAGKPLKEVIADQADQIAEADTQARVRANQLGIMGPAIQGSALGGTKNGGGATNARKPPNPDGNQGPARAPSPRSRPVSQ